MGRVYNEIKAPGYREAVTRIFRLDEQEGISSIAPEIMPVITLEHERPEWYALRGIWCFGSVPNAIAGGVGQFSFIQLPLPATATVIAIVYMARNPNAIQVTARVNSTLRSGGTAANPLDRRAAAGLTSQVRIVTGSAAAAEGTAVDLTDVVAGFTGVPDKFENIINKYVISPGQSLTFWGETANTAVLLPVAWMEKPVTQDELGIVG